MTNEQHNRYISWAFLGHGAFQVFMGLLMMAFMSIFFFIPDDGRGGAPPTAFLAAMGAFIFVFQGAMAAPAFIAAYGLRKKRSWARTASIVAAVLAAMNVPIGTAACVYALWFFLGDNWKEIYPEVAFAKDERTRTFHLTHDRETRWTGYHQNEKGEISFHPVNPPDWR